jgi:hypothetical protein
MRASRQRQYRTFTALGTSEYFSLFHKDCPSSLGGGVRAVSIGFRLLSGATAPHAKPTGACVEIVFVGIRLCDRLTYADLSERGRRKTDRQTHARTAGFARVAAVLHGHRLDTG